MASPDNNRYRGYIGCRSLNGSRAAQHIQNIVIRDYAKNNGFQYLLSGVEYVMPESFLVLSDIIKEIPSIKGIIFYSLFMLPKEKSLRFDIYEKILNKGAEIHFALEDLIVSRENDISRIEDIILIQPHIKIITL